MKLVLAIFLLVLLWLPALSVRNICAAAKAARVPKQWTLLDTVNQALSHSPAVKREGETVNMQRQSLREAKAGYLPKLNVQASGGAATLPVSRNE